MCFEDSRLRAKTKIKYDKISQNPKIVNILIPQPYSSLNQGDNIQIKPSQNNDNKSHQLLHKNSSYSMLGQPTRN